MTTNPINTVATIPHTAVGTTSGETPWQQLLRTCRAWQALILANPQTFRRFDPATLNEIQRRLHTFEQIKPQNHLPLFLEVAYCSGYYFLASRIYFYSDATQWLHHARLRHLIFEYYNGYGSLEEDFESNHHLHPLLALPYSVDIQDFTLSLIKANIKHGYYTDSQVTKIPSPSTKKQIAPMIPNNTAYSIFQDALIQACRKSEECRRAQEVALSANSRMTVFNPETIISEIQERANVLSRFAIPNFAPEFHDLWAEMFFLLGDTSLYAKQFLLSLFIPELSRLISKYYGNGIDLVGTVSMETYLPITRPERDQRFEILLTNLQKHYPRPARLEPVLQDVPATQTQPPRRPAGTIEFFAS